jgi:hypothetical protein
MTESIRRKVLLISLLAVVVSTPLAADVGLGVILGDPTGISALFDNRIAAAVAWDVSNYLHLHGDVWLIRRLLAEPVDWYLGVGGKVKFFNEGTAGEGPPWEAEEDDPPDGVGVGIRVPLGIQWYALPELELFGEIVPGISLFPSTGFDMDLGIGVRYHFGAGALAE